MEKVIKARRVFRDGKDRIVKTIYYDARPTARNRRPPGVELTEDDLVMLFTQIHKYDESGREVEIEYDRPHTLNSNALTQKIFYSEDGKGTRRVYFDAKGTRLREIRETVGSTRPTSIDFDSTGEKVVLIHGPLPDDVDLAYGWGEPIDGVSCGIAPTHSHGPADDINIHVAVKNETDRPQTICCVYPFATLHLELRDTRGKLVEPSEERRRDFSHWRRKPPDRYPTEELPGHSAMSRLGWPPGSLKQWFDRIEPGTYTFKVRLLHREPDVFLLSNTITIEIE